MQLKNNLVLLACAAIGLGICAYSAKTSARTAGSKLNGLKILPAFDVSAVAKIEAGDLVLAAADGGWKVESYRGYPADRAKIAEQLLKLGELKVGQVIRGREAGAEKKVTLRDAGGAVLAETTLGDAHPSKNGWGSDGRYVAFRGETVLVNDALEAFDGDPKAWIETKIVDEPRISFDTLAPADVDDATTGFATGVVAKVTVAGDTNRTATVGAAVKGGSNRYLKLDGETWVYEVPGWSVEKLLPAPVQAPVK